MCVYGRQICSGGRERGSTAVRQVVEGRVPYPSFLMLKKYLVSAVHVKGQPPRSELNSMLRATD